MELLLDLDPDFLLLDDLFDVEESDEEGSRGLLLLLLLRDFFVLLVPSSLPRLGSFLELRVPLLFAVLLEKISSSSMISFRSDKLRDLRCEGRLLPVLENMSFGAEYLLAFSLAERFDFMDIRVF